PALPWKNETSSRKNNVSVVSRSEALRSANALGSVAQGLAHAASQTAAAHAAFLESSARSFGLQAAALEARRRILARLGGAAPAPAPAPTEVSGPKRPAFDRELCMEFAVGSLAKVLGPA